MEILETFQHVFCFQKSRINENGGNGKGIEFVAQGLKLQCLEGLIETSEGKLLTLF